MGPTSIEAFERAGGAAALMKQLERHLHLDVMTVSGGAQRDNLDKVDVSDSDAIRSMERPLSDKAAIVVMRGSVYCAGRRYHQAWLARQQNIEFCRQGARV